MANYATQSLLRRDSLARPISLFVWEGASGWRRFWRRLLERAHRRQPAAEPRPGTSRPPPPPPAPPASLGRRWEDRLGGVLPRLDENADSAALAASWLNIGLRGGFGRGGEPTGDAPEAGAAATDPARRAQEAVREWRILLGPHRLSALATELARVESPSQVFDLLVGRTPSLVGGFAAIAALPGEAEEALPTGEPVIEPFDPRRPGVVSLISAPIRGGGKLCVLERRQGWQYGSAELELLRHAVVLADSALERLAHSSGPAVTAPMEH